MKHISLGITLYLAFSAPVMADRWIPYTDGRTGGCFQNENGNLFGCTPQPARPSQREAREVIYRDRADPAVDELEILRALRSERYRQESNDQSAAAEKARRSKALANYLDEIDRREKAEQGARNEQQWLISRTGCNSPEYSMSLKKMALKPHPTARGICIPANSKAGRGVIVAESCPPCR